jgi:peptidoglycan/LPS O-acetylase OafA/YrhL
LKRLGTNAIPAAGVPPSSNKESTNLDVLRSVAVVLVIFSHVMPSFFPQIDPAIGVNVGRLGVLFFFVHTSLVLMESMDRIQNRGEKLFSSFYIRRLFRIYPLSIFCILLVLGFHSLPSVVDHSPITRKELWSNLLLVQNWTDSRSLIVVLWSLPYEVQMYLVLPVLYLFVHRFSSTIATLALWVISVALAMEFPLYLGIGFAPCFIAGILAYKMPKFVKIPALYWPLFLVALTGSFLAFDPHHKGWLTCLVLGVAIPQFSDIREGLIAGISHFIAKYSYGIYILHQPFLVIGHLVLSRMSFVPEPLQIALLIGMAVSCSFVLYHAIEHPMIYVGSKLARRLSNRTPTYKFSNIPG